MALIKGESEELWQCQGWDGNNEPCPGKLPQKIAYCALSCEFLTVYNPYTDWGWGCKKYWEKLAWKEKGILKCKSCLSGIFLCKEG
jgi:hypothetical protein